MTSPHRIAPCACDRFGRDGCSARTRCEHAATRSGRRRRGSCGSTETARRPRRSRCDSQPRAIEDRRRDARRAAARPAAVVPRSRSVQSAVSPQKAAGPVHASAESVAGCLRSRWPPYHAGIPGSCGPSAPCRRSCACCAPSRPQTAHRPRPDARSRTPSPSWCRYAAVRREKTPQLRVREPRRRSAARSGMHSARATQATVRHRRRSCRPAGSARACQ